MARRLDHSSVFGGPAGARQGGAIVMSDEEAAALLLFSRQVRDAARACGYLLSFYNSVGETMRHRIPQDLADVIPQPLVFAVLPFPNLRGLFMPATWVGMNGFARLLDESGEAFWALSRASAAGDGLLAADVKQTRETTLAAACFAKITLKDLSAIHQRFFREVDVAEYNYYANLIDDVIDGRCRLYQGGQLLPVKTDFQLREHRVWVNAEAHVIGSAVMHRVCVRNISMGGIGFDGAEPLGAGQMVDVRLAQSGRRLSGRIAWKIGSKAGLEFFERLAADDALLTGE